MLECRFENGATTTRLRHVVVEGILYDQDRILLTKRADWLIGGGKWSLPGGFVDHDERVSDAIIREIQEETGYESTVTRWLGVIDSPKQTDSDRQNIAFLYQLSKGDQIGQMDTHEVSEMEWFTLNALPKKEEIAFDHFSIIHTWAQHRESSAFIFGDIR